MVWPYLLPNKESAVVQSALERWAVKVERQSGHKVKTLRSDNGTEFKGAVEEWMENQGIEHQLTAPYSPQQNGRVERWHKTLGEGVRTLLLASGLPANLWGEAVQYLTWIRNRLIHKTLGDKSPYEMWSGVKPGLSMVRTWGSMACSLLPEPARDGKLSPRGRMFVVLGVDNRAKAWRVLDPQTMEVQISRNLHFTETLMWKDWKPANPAVVLGVSKPEEVLNVLPAQEEVWVEIGIPVEHQSEPADDSEPVPEPEPEERPRGSGRGTGGKRVRFAEPLSTAEEPVRAEFGPEQGPVATPGDGEESDDDLDTLARTNHRTRALTQLYGLAAEADETAAIGDHLLTDAEAEASIHAWCFSSAAVSADRPRGKITTPGSVGEALSGPQAAQWKQAIDTEWAAMKGLKV